MIGQCTLERASLFSLDVARTKRGKYQESVRAETEIVRTYNISLQLAGHDKVHAARTRHALRKATLRSERAQGGS